MCDFISWIESRQGKKKHVLFLTDHDVFSTKKGKELQECSGSEDDYCGHGFIRQFFGMTDKAGSNRECTDFSSPKNFPPEIVRAIKAGKIAKISTTSRDISGNDLIELLDQNVIRKIDWNEIIDSIEFESPIIDEEGIKENLKRIFSKGEAGASVEFGENSEDILNYFNWSKTKEGRDYWQAVCEADKSCDEIPEIDLLDDDVAEIWKLFKNKKNRSKAWK